MLHLFLSKNNSLFHIQNGGVSCNISKPLSPDSFSRCRISQVPAHPLAAFVPDCLFKDVYISKGLRRRREWREMSRRHEWYLDDLGLVDFAKDLGV